MPRAKAWTTPPEVANHPSYKTPELETNSAKRRRVVRRRQAKTKARKKIQSVCAELGGSLTIEREGSSHVVQEDTQVEMTNNPTGATIRSESPELRGHVMESRTGGKYISKQLFVTQHFQPLTTSCVLQGNDEGLMVTLTSAHDCTSRETFSQISNSALLTSNNDLSIVSLESMIVHQELQTPYQSTIGRPKLFATPEEISRDPRYMTPEQESPRSKRMRKTNRAFAKVRARQNSVSCLISAVAQPTPILESMEEEMRVAQEATPAQREMGRRRTFDTPEEIAMDRRYMTPENESPQSKRRRKAKRHTAKIRTRQQGSDLQPALHRAACSMELPGLLDLGCMDVECIKCGARHWAYESDRTCCGNGQVQLPSFPQLPQFLNDLYTKEDETCRLFRKNIRKYNNVFSFASLGVNVDENFAGGAYCFRVNGRMCHRMGALRPSGHEPPKFAQIYIMDGFQNQLDQRRSIFEGLSQNILRQIQEYLSRVNPFVRMFHRAARVMDIYPTVDVRFRIPSCDVNNVARRQWNAPMENEIAVLMPVDDRPTDGQRDIILHTLSGDLQTVDALHSAYDSLHYVLMFPEGSDGWHLGIPKTVSSERRPQHVTCMDFYKYHIYTRENPTSPLHLGGRLFHEYICDMFAKVEQNRLRYIETHQHDIVMESVQGVMDHIGDDARTIGRKVTLPSSYVGSPRYMYQLYQDAMAMVRTMGKPDLFITMTANPKWDEIIRELLPGQTHSDRPDLVARVFEMKKKKLLDLLTVDQLFGKLIGKVHVIEFQKRGLPHIHMLLILDAMDKPTSPEDYDKIVCAEIPDRSIHPELYEVVTRHMMHGPCGPLDPHQKCMKDGKCSRRFPREFINATMVNNGYPIYRRRLDNQMVNGLDNRWVVPYNPWLATHFKCHINVEVCTTIKSVKYLYKYVYKGPDMISYLLEAEGEDNVARTQRFANDGASSISNPPSNKRITSMIGQSEVQQFLNARYFSAAESCWRLLGYNLQQQKPSVQRLAIHLPNLQNVVFNDEMTLEEVSNRNFATTLTEFFRMNATGHPEACDMLYHDYTKKFTWDVSKKTWVKRSNVQRFPTIGRMVFVNPKEGERFYLRLLLTKIPGPTSFEHLKIIDGLQCHTFKEAAVRCGLCREDGEEWLRCLQEAAIWGMPRELRQMFATIHATTDPTNSQELWMAMRNFMVEDFLYKAKEVVGDDNLQPNDVLYRYVLHDIEMHMNDLGKSLTSFGYNVTINEEEDYICPEVLAEGVIQEDVNQAEEYVGRLNPEQRAIFNRIAYDCVLDRRGGVFFIDGPGGTGKTYLYNALLAFLRAKRLICLAVASSGIASTLLKGGRTAHSRFKIPINLFHKDHCWMSRQSDEAKLIRATSLIVWDEAPMLKKVAFEAVDQTFRFIKDCDRPFGGIPVVFGGDFRQILPVVKRGSRAQIVEETINRSYIWDFVEVHKLTTNMRIMGLIGPDRERQQLFADLVLRIGDGVELTFDEVGFGYVRLPDHMCMDSNDVNDVIELTFEDIAQNYNDVKFWTSRAILTPLNNDVNDINMRVTNMLPGDPVAYYSADRCIDEDDANIYPIEFLHSLELSGMPQHKLVLKVGMIIMLIRSISNRLGMLNGTRLIIRNLSRRVIDAEVVSGKNVGSRVFIPRIPLVPTDNELPFQFERLQFPVKPAFAMTINKAQGQTMERVGLYLPNPVFSHGQLYVAISRVQSPDHIKVLIKTTAKRHDSHKYTANVVYTEVFRPPRRD